MDRPRLLIISFSDIANDARVKKQIALFSEDFRVTTCGFGAPPQNDVEHLSLVDDDSRWGKYLDAVLVRMRMYKVAYRWHTRARAARKALRGRSFDVAIANDIDTIGVAFDTVGAEKTHADLHEYFPGLHDQMPDWVKVRKPYFQWLLAKYAARAGSTTTVSDAIAERYNGEYGFQAEVVRNATVYHDLTATPVGSPIRLVHSGGAQENRQIEVMMQAVAASRANVTLDLYLTQHVSPYANKLRELASSLGTRITIHHPVPQSELVETLNDYDVGIHVLPPTNTNNSLALPNKFFDYLQARLAMVIGPTIDMARLLQRFDLGVVADDFSVDAVTRTIDGLTREDIERWKSNALAAAPMNCAENEAHVWGAALDALIQRSDDTKKRTTDR